MLGLLSIPFLPVQSLDSVSILSWIKKLTNISDPGTGFSLGLSDSTQINPTVNWMNDFAISISQDTSSSIGLILCGVWIMGMLFMAGLIVHSKMGLNCLKRSALPLQNEKVRLLYENCLSEMNISKGISIYSTAFLKSPIIVGHFNPCIYLPIHLISDCNTADIRYMLLHELQHYKHKDAIANFLMNLASIVYWFNPFVWFALREMRNDREIACDSGVLEMLDDDCYEEYGNTLINFTVKISLIPFPFTSGLSSSMKQMKRRIINIAYYQKPSMGKRVWGITFFIVTASLLIGFAPILSTYAKDDTRYHWDVSEEKLSNTDFSSYFQNFDGSFVLYDLDEDLWTVHNMETAATRVAPNSTYKIYDALFGLDANVITPLDSIIPWDHKEQPIEAWNADHNLQSAMENSVNWYFQSIDKQLGHPLITKYVHTLGYGNEDTSGDLSSYWMESSLKISPVEQVELLTELYTNKLPFAEESMNAVKNTLHISSSKAGSFYGKTGTGRVNEQDINGWFIGYVESLNGTYFFATNIQGNKGASGSKALDISLSILSDTGILTQ